MEQLDNMTVLDKAAALEGCLANSNNVEYSVQVAWGVNVNQDEEKARMRTLISNARELFGTGRIQSLDYDTREATFRKWHAQFNAELQKFPEFGEPEEKRSVRL